MQRRAFLRAGGAAGIGVGASLTVPGSVGASPTPVASLSAGATPTGYEPLGSVEVPGAAEAVVGDGGDVAYLATTDGFATVDVSDPSGPDVLAERSSIEVDGDPLTDVWDVDVDGGRLAVVGPAHRTSDDVFHGIVVYDVSDPADPVRVGQPHETGYHIHNCYLAEDLLYVVANREDENPLVVFDVSDDEPTEIGRWSLLEHEPGWADVYWRARYLHDVYVHEGVAYLAHWNAGTYLLDVSEPTDPEYLSRVMETSLEEQRDLADEDAQLGLPGNDHYSAVDENGDLLAVGREAWETGGAEPDGPGGIDLYDVSDPSAPERLASIDAPEADDESYDGGEWTTAHNFELRDGRLYSSWYQGGVTVHDVTDPAAPEALATWRDPDVAGFWTARVAGDGDVFVASSTSMIPETDTEGALYTFPTAVEPADPIPGLTGAAGVAGVAGGAIGLEWLRRRTEADDE